MKKRNRKQLSYGGAQRVLGYIVIGCAVLSAFLTGGDITASLLLGLLGISVLLVSEDEPVDDDDERYKLKFFYGKNEGES